MSSPPTSGKKPQQQEGDDIGKLMFEDMLSSMFVVHVTAFLDKASLFNFRASSKVGHSIVTKGTQYLTKERHRGIQERWKKRHKRWLGDDRLQTPPLSSVAWLFCWIHKATRYVPLHWLSSKLHITKTYQNLVPRYRIKAGQPTIAVDVHEAVRISGLKFKSFYHLIQHDNKAQRQAKERMRMNEKRKAQRKKERESNKRQRISIRV